MSPEKPTLDSLVREAKESQCPETDWSKVEAKLFPRVEREARAQAALGEYGGKKRAWVAVAAVIAVAAAIPLFVGHGSGELARSLDGDAVRDAITARPPSAGTLAEKDRNATVHAANSSGSRDLAAGDAIAQGDTVDVHAGRAILTRTEPGAVTWALEDGSQVEVRAARGTLILALAKGAVEAQVAPVEAGEAFAIDVEGTRVAVHGTHLRVERQGNRAIVDLRYGVFSIGVPPKSGSTYGDLVTAPAHVEFDSADPHGTLKVSHESARVRISQSLTIQAQPKSARSEETATPPLPRPAPGAERTAARVDTPAPSLPSRLAPAQPPPALATAVAAPPATVTSPVPPPPEPAQVDPNAERTIVDQVRACAAKHVEHADGVVITVSSRLDLRIGDTGMVSAAKFDPPLLPEVQECASRAIFGTRFAQPGAVNIPIDVTP
jgi:hypothetical protein